MKIKKLFGNWSKAIKTFPISHTILLTISICLIGKIEGILNNTGIDKLMIALGFTFLISCYGPLIFIHSDIKNKNSVSWISQILSLIIGGIYYIIIFYIDNLTDLTYSDNLLYFGIIFLAGLGIPLVTAILHRKDQSKIRFSRSSLIISIILGGIAGSIVRGGISGALASIESLFDVYIDSDRYLYIGTFSEILLAGSFVFNYYLTLIEDINKSDFKITSSRIRKIFGSFIFLPLAIVYLLIFGAYGIKILITGNRPSGIIVRLGIGYFVLGTFSTYLTFPNKTKTHELINNILYISFIFIACMMIGAIIQRINQYGITINRRFICIIISFIIIYSSLSLIFQTKRLISFIYSLTILSLLTLYGPINATNISFKSQINKLENIVQKEKLHLPLQGGDLQDIDSESASQMMSILKELTTNYNANKIIDKIITYDYKHTYRYNRISEIGDYLGSSTSDTKEHQYYFYYRQNKYESDGIDIENYSTLHIFSESTTNKVLKLKFNKKSYEIDLSDYIEILMEKSDEYTKNNTDLTQPALILQQDDYKLIINGFHGEKVSNSVIHFNNIEGYFLIK